MVSLLNLEKKYNFKLYRNYLSQSSRRKILILIKKLLEKNIKKKIDLKDISKYLQILNKKNKKKITSIYNETQYLLFLNYSKFKLIDKKLLNNFFKKKKYLMNMPTIRFDFPNDKNYILPWHQEIKSSGKFKTKNFFQVWCPINTDSDEKNGSLILKENSKKTIFKHQKNKTKYLKELIQIKDKRIKKKKIYQTSVNKGDAIIFYPETIHKSGFNKSNEVRLTLTISFHELGKNDVHPKLLIRE